MAIADTKNGKSSNRTAAEKYEILVSTLCDKIKVNVSILLNFYLFLNVHST